MGRKLNEIKKIEKNKRKKIAEAQKLKKVKADAEKVAKKKIVELSPTGKRIRIIKN